MDKAIDILSRRPCDVFNHNLETVPRLYQQARPGADYIGSLQLLRKYQEARPETPTKSGLMLGIGETIEEVHQVMRDLLDHGCTMLTLGQYLPPSKAHLPVQRYLSPREFDDLADTARALGFHQVASAPLVRSSYHADLQAKSVIYE